MIQGHEPSLSPAPIFLNSYLIKYAIQNCAFGVEILEKKWFQGPNALGTFV